LGSKLPEEKRQQAAALQGGVALSGLVRGAQPSQQRASQRPRGANCARAGKPPSYTGDVPLHAHEPAWAGSRGTTFFRCSWARRIPRGVPPMKQMNRWTLWSAYVCLRFFRVSLLTAQAVWTAAQGRSGLGSKLPEE